MVHDTPIPLSRLQQEVKATLVEHFALPRWITAEIADLKVNYAGHCYLELVEKGTSDGVPKAQARAVIWRSHYPRLATSFQVATGTPLAPGMQILVKALVSYHELYGFSLQITEIDAAYSLGDMERRKQETISRLQQEGVWEMNRQQSLPIVVQRIAVLSSARAAGWQDFYRELSLSPYRFQLTLFEAVMQGEAAEDSLIAALTAVAERNEEFDLVVIIRGGGSTSDLQCYNAYRLANHIAQFPLPIVTGIGHDKDTSIADLVAHTSLKTPTAVAGWLVERMQRIEGWLDTAALTLHEAALRRERDELLRLERFRGEILSRATQWLERETGRIQNLTERLSEGAQLRLQQAQQRLENYQHLVESHSPQRILRLGFSLIRKSKRAVGSVEELMEGDRIEVVMHDGTRQATIRKEEITSPKE